jgi:hypothetical protein
MIQNNIEWVKREKIRWIDAFHNSQKFCVFELFPDEILKKVFRIDHFHSWFPRIYQKPIITVLLPSEAKTEAKGDIKIKECHGKP